MRVSVRGSDFFFDVAGTALGVEGGRLVARPTVLALHGGPGFDHAYLKPALATLSHSAQVVYLDLRSQGRSARMQIESCTLDNMAEDVAAFCDALGLDKPLVVGHSAGGHVGLKLALRHPGRVGALVLVNAAARVDLAQAFTTLERHHGGEVRKAAERVFAGDVGPEALDRYMRLVGPTYAHPDNAIALRDLSLSRFAPEVAAHVFLHELPKYDERDALKNIEIPVLAITGDSDWLAPPALIYETIREIKKGAAVVLPNTGHLACNERPSKIAELIRNVQVTP